jgi:hypothetical protein
MGDANGETVRPVTNGRAPGGQFGPGNRYGRGNPNALKMFEYRQAMLGAVNPEIVEKVTKRLAIKALEGDLDAIKVFLDYCVGKPPAALELSGPDGAPLGVELAGVEAAILAALEPFGSGARFAVAAALRGVVVDAGRAESTGPEA